MIGKHIMHLEGNWKLDQRTLMSTDWIIQWKCVREFGDKRKQIVKEVRWIGRGEGIKDSG